MVYFHRHLLPKQTLEPPSQGALMGSSRKGSEAWGAWVRGCAEMHCTYIVCSLGKLIWGQYQVSLIGRMLGSLIQLEPCHREAGVPEERCKHRGKEPMCAKEQCHQSPDRDKTRKTNIAPCRELEQHLSGSFEKVPLQIQMSKTHSVWGSSPPCKSPGLGNDIETLPFESGDKSACHFFVCLPLHQYYFRRIGWCMWHVSTTMRWMGVRKVLFMAFESLSAS